MAHVHETTEINATPEVVWGLLGDPGRIGEWLPALAGSTVEGDTRSCTTQDGAQIRERIVEHSDAQRYYIYEVTESPFPLTFYRSRIAVEGHDGHTHVSWEADFRADPADAEGELTTMLAQMYRDGLASVRQRIEQAGGAPAT